MSTWDKTCEFCSQTFRITNKWGEPEVQEYLAAYHHPKHVEEMCSEDSPLPMCGRCQRYRESGLSPITALHRRCFEVGCLCSCSFVRTLNPRGTDASLKRGSVLEVSDVEGTPL